MDGHLPEGFQNARPVGRGPVREGARGYERGGHKGDQYLRMIRPSKLIGSVPSGETGRQELGGEDQVKDRRSAYRTKVEPSVDASVIQNGEAPFARHCEEDVGGNKFCVGNRSSGISVVVVYVKIPSHQYRRRDTMEDN